MPLDRVAGDGERIHVLRGDAERVREELVALERGAPGEAAARLAAARALLEVFAGPGLFLALDLRAAEAGQLARPRRRGNRSEQLATLPWLVLRSARGEARVVRRLLLSIRRSFGQGVERRGRRCELDELWLEVDGRRLRRPMGGLDRVAEFARATLDEEASGAAPGWERSLPPTAPSGRRPGAMLPGLLAAALLLMGLPLCCGRLARTSPGRVSPIALDQGPLAPVAIGRALASRGSVWTQRKALVGAEGLEPRARVRLFRQVAADPDRPVDVRLQAVSGLARCGLLAGPALLRLEESLAREASVAPSGLAAGVALEVRLAALRSVADLPQPWAEAGRARARTLLAAAETPPPLRMLAALLLAGGPVSEPDCAALGAALGKAGALSRAQAAWALAIADPSGWRDALRVAFLRTAREVGEPGLRGPLARADEALALERLVRALAVAGDRAWLLQALERLPGDGALRDALERLLVGGGG